MRAIPSILLLATAPVFMISSGSPSPLVSESGDDLRPEIPGPCQMIIVRTSVFNSGAEPVTVESVQPSCGCTSAEISPKTIEPGATAQLEVAVNPLLTHGKDLRENVALVTQNGEDLFLSISGEVPPCVSLGAGTADFGDLTVEEGAPAGHDVLLELLAPEAVETLSIETSDPRLKAQLVDGSAASERVIRIELDPANTLGRSNEKVVLKVNDLPMDALTVSWNAQSSRLRIDRLPIHLGVIALEETTKKTATLQIADGWEVQSIGTEGSAFQVVAPAAKDASGQLALEIAGRPTEKGPNAGYVILTLAGPDGAEAVVRYRLPVRVLGI